MISTSVARSIKRITVAFTFLTVMTLVLSVVSMRPVSAQNQGCTIDTSAVSDLLTKAKTAYAGGDTKAGDEAVMQARNALSGLPAQCADKAQMASCTFVFDATIRKGPDAGLNLHGKLVLIQTAEKTIAGYVIPAGFDPKAANAANMLVPVEGTTDNSKISMNFKVGSGIIAGTGTIEVALAQCGGAIEGTAQGPRKDSTGDWLGGAELSSCISAGVSKCVRQYGANGSGVCSATEIDICRSSSPSR